MLIIFSSTFCFSQDEWEGTGEIEEAEVIIEKDRTIILPIARRLFEKVPAFEQQSGILGLTYDYIPIQFAPGDLNTRVRPLTVRAKPLPLVRGNNVKVGYGNFGTPFIQGSLGSKRNDEYLMDLFIRHRSSNTGPVDGENSADSESVIDLSGSIFLDQATVSGNLYYKRDGFHFYGYDQSQEVNEADIRQVLNNFTFAGKISSNLPDNESAYDLTAVFDYVQDYYFATEADFGFNFFGRIPVKENYSIELISDLHLINRKDVLLPSSNRYFLRFKPYLNYVKENLDIDFGFTAIIEDDTLGDNKPLRLFPYLNVAYAISSNVQVYGGYKGDVDKMTLKSYLNENRYLGQNVNVFNQIKSFDFYAGIKGKFGYDWSYDVGTELTYFKNRPYFVNDPADTVKFMIIYDTESSSTNHFYGSVGYDITEKLNLGIRAENYIYNTSDLVEEAWHRPTYRIDVMSTFKILDKFKLTADAYIIGGIKARQPISGITTELDPIVDLNVGFEYLISKQASVFFKTYNLLSRENQRFLNYSSREFQWLAGLSYSF